MSSETYNPGPLAFPDCWIAGNTIGPIVITYDGPSLEASSINLTFNGGLSPVVASAVAAPEEGYPNRWLITFPAFEPESPDDSVKNNEVYYKVHVDYGASASPMLSRTLHFGSWKIRTLPV